MMRKFLLMQVSAVLLCTCSCHVLHHSYDGDKQITIGTRLTRPHQEVGRIAGGKKAFFLLFGLIPLNSASGPEMADRLAREKYGSSYDGIIRLQIVEEMNTADSVVNILAGIIFSMMTVHVAGEVHQFAGP